MTALWLTALLAARPAPGLEQAMLFYQRLEFPRCIATLEKMPTPVRAQEHALLELYLGLCGFHARRPDARAHFKAALELDRDVPLPPLTSPKIQAIVDELKAALPKPAPPDAPVAVELQPVPPPPPPPPIVTAEPLAPGPPLVVPIGLFAGAAAAAGVGVGFGLSAQGNQRAGDAKEFASEAAPYDAAARQQATIANVSYGVAGALAVAGAITLIVRLAR